MPRASAAGVEVILVTFEFRARLDSSAFDVLTDDERASAARFVRHEDAMRYAATRAALRELLGTRLAAPARGLSLERDIHGRPRLAHRLARESVDFNVSHSGEHALLAFSRKRRVGVDIEAQQTGLDWQSLAPAVLAPADEAHLRALPEHRHRNVFYDAWTAKEALLKALGVGIAIEMTHFSVLGNSSDAPDVHLIGTPSESAEVSLPAVTAFDAVWFEAPAGYAACVAWSRSALPALHAAL